MRNWESHIRVYGICSVLTDTQQPHHAVVHSSLRKCRFLIYHSARFAINALGLIETAAVAAVGDVKQICDEWVRVCVPAEKS